MEVVTEQDLRVIIEIGTEDPHQDHVLVLNVEAEVDHYQQVHHEEQGIYVMAHHLEEVLPEHVFVFRIEDLVHDLAVAVHCVNSVIDVA